ncbi:Ubiquitin-like protein 3, partial [Trachymyrmex zeteki]
YTLQINLRLILVSGKTKEFLFSPSDSAGDIAHHVFENWPEGSKSFGTFGNFSQTARLSWGELSASCKCYLGVADWAEEAVAKAEILRLIYQGRFLHSNVTLGALGLPFGKTTVMHLVPRENLPEPNSQVAELVSSVARETDCRMKEDLARAIFITTADYHRGATRVAMMRSPVNESPMSLGRSLISVRLAGGNACSINTLTREICSRRRKRRRRAYFITEKSDHCRHVD